MEHALAIAVPVQPVLNPETGKGLRGRMAEYSARTGALARKFAKAAAPVVAGAGLQYAFKTAAIGTAVAAGANIYGAAFVGGATVTVVGVAQDYRKFRREQKDKASGLWGVVRDFFQFIGGRKKEYGTKLLKNTGLSALGAGIVDNFDAITDGAGKALDFVKERVSGFSLFSEARAETVQVSPDEAVQESSDQALVAAEIPAQSTDFKTIVQSIDASGWSAQAQADLKAAQAGKTWAIQNIAHYAANGFQNVPKDIGMARMFAEESASRNYRLSTRFLADLDKIAPSSVAQVVSAPVPVPVSAPVAAVPMEVAPAVVMNELPVQQALETPEGVVTIAVPTVAGGMMVSELSAPEKVTFFGAEVQDSIACRETFRDAAGVVAHHCPESEAWLGVNGSVEIQNVAGEKMFYVNGGKEPVWGPNFVRDVLEAHLGQGPVLNPPLSIAAGGPN